MCRVSRVQGAVDVSLVTPPDKPLTLHAPKVDRESMPTPKPLRIPAFRRLATSYTLNELGWGFGTVALAVLVFERTGSAMATTLLFLSTTFLPALLAPVLTTHLDRIAVRRTLPGLYLIEALLFAFLIVVAERFWLPAVLLLALADGAIAIAGRALTRAAVASALKPSGSLAAGNKLLNVLFSVAFAAGPALAGAVIHVAGVSASLGLTALLFTVMALVLATSRDLPAGRPEPDRSWSERLRGGLRYVRRNRAVRRVLGVHAAALSLAAAATPIEVVYAAESLDAGPAAYGLLLGVWGAGTVLSSVGLARARRAPALWLIPLGASSIGLGFLTMAVAPSLSVALAGCLVGGAGNGVYYVSVVQALQERIDDEFLARVMGLLESTTAASYGAGFLLGGVLTALADARLALAVAGSGILLAAAVIVLLIRGDHHGFRRPGAQISPQPEPAR
jgi:MFS family permease